MSTSEIDSSARTPLAYSPEAAAAAGNVGRTTIFAEIKAGNLKARKVGRRTIILATDFQGWLSSLPLREVA